MASAKTPSGIGWNAAGWSGVAFRVTTVSCTRRTGPWQTRHPWVRRQSWNAATTGARSPGGKEADKWR